MFRFFVGILFVLLAFSDVLAQPGRPTGIEPAELPRGSSKPVTKVDSRGNVTFTCNEVAGKFQGLCATYFADGTQKTEQVFVNGKQSGVFKVFYEDGQTVKSVCTYVNGKCVGAMFNYFDDGKTIETHYVYDANGLKHGAQWDYWITGIPRVYAVWNHGTPVNTKVYDELGVLVEEWDGWGIPPDVE